MAQLLPEASAQNLANMLWAYAKLEYNPGAALLEQFGGCILADATQQQCTPQNVSNMLWAYATLSHLPGRQLLDAAAEYATAHLDAFHPQVGCGLVYQIKQAMEAWSERHFVQSFSIHINCAT